MELHEFKVDQGRKSAFVLKDGKRVVAKATPRAPGGYLIRAVGLALLDKKPSPTAPNVFGIATPDLWHVRDVRTVRRTLERLRDSGRR